MTEENTEQKSQNHETKDLKTLKHDILAEFDNFVLDENLDHQAKAIALAQLDKLIKQDLLAADILMQQYKKRTKVDAQSLAVALPKFTSHSSGKSNNILDLREKLRQQQEVKKLTKYQQFLAKIKKIKIPKASFKHKQSKLEPREAEILYTAPVEEKPYTRKTWSFNFKLIQKLAIFALILAILLSPLRFLVLLGRIQDDKATIWQLGKSGILNLQSGILSASENAYQSADINFEQALQNFNEIQAVLNEYDQWILAAGQKIPGVGKSLNVSTNLLKVADNISQAALTLNQKLQSEEPLTEHIVFLQDKINESLPYLKDASKNIEKIKIESLPLEMQDYFASLKDYLPKITQSLGNLEDVLVTMADILGHEKEKRYLVLFQNNNELRATGGFIGSFALLDIYQGEIKNLEIPRGGTYDLTAGQVAKIKAPKALSLINPYFNIWDANWWPDFPTSAQKIMWFYQNFGGSTTDGVIALNADVLQALLKVLGPQSMPAYNVNITADNLFSVIQNEVELNYDKTTNEPKAIIADLAPLLLDQLLQNKEHQKEIVATLAEQLANKNIQLYLSSASGQEKIKQFAWAGEVLSSQKDYLQVINTNIAGGKTDNDIYQTIDHQAEILANGEIVNTVKITRVNKGLTNNPLAGIDGGNVSYMRFFVPKGSEFIEAVGFDTLAASYFQTAAEGTMIDKDLEAEEISKMLDAASQTEIFQSLDKTVFANWLALKPGESKTVAIKYKLPFKIDLADPLVNNWWTKLLSGDVSLDNYSLLIQSQAGSKNTIFNSTVLLPDNLKVVWNQSSAMDKMSVNNKLVTYTSDLVGDQYFGFILSSK